MDRDDWIRAGEHVIAGLVISALVLASFWLDSHWPLIVLAAAVMAIREQGQDESRSLLKLSRLMEWLPPLVIVLAAGVIGTIWMS